MPVTFSQIEVSIQVSAKMVTTHEESGSFGGRAHPQCRRADEPRRPFRAALCPLRPPTLLTIPVLRYMHADLVNVVVR